MIFLEAAKKIISIESTPESGTLEVINYLKHHISSLEGFNIAVDPSETFGNQQSNIYVSYNDLDISTNNALLMLTHLDTTDPGSYGHWDKTSGNPFNLSIYGNELYGLGVTNKLDFLCKLEALKSFKAMNLKRPVILAGTHSEENGLYGAVEFIDKYKNQFTQSIIYHPTDLSIAAEGLGIAVVEIEIPFSEEEKKYHQLHDLADNSITQSKVFRGKSAHSSQAEESESAIVKLFEFLEKMPNVVIMSVDGGILHNTVAEHALVEFVPSGSIKNNIKEKLLRVYSELNILRDKFKKYPHEGYANHISTLNIGKIRSSKEGIVVTGNCRLLPSVPEKEYRSWILNLKNFCHQLECKFKFKRYVPSFIQEKSSNFVEQSMEVINDLQLKNTNVTSSTICTEANLIQKHGVDCILFGAGKSLGNSHQPNESINIESLNQSINFYKNMITKVCL